MNKEYLELLERKRHTIGNFGFEPTWYPDIAFDFQKYVIEKSIQNNTDPEGNLGFVSVFN